MKKISNKAPLSELIYITLRKEILDGDLKPGQRLMEVHYAKKLGVSRTPFREAVRKLEQEGLVAMIPRRGAHVRQLTSREIADVLQVRAALDVLAVKLAVEYIKEDDISSVKHIEEAFEKSVSENNLNGIIEGDIAFHDFLFGASGNSVLLGLYRSIKDRIYRFRALYIKDVSNLEIIMEEHRKIIEAIDKRDVSMAEQAAFWHIKNQENGVLKYIKKGSKSASLRG